MPETPGCLSAPCIPLHARFESQVSRSRDATAVTCEGRHSLFFELNVRANRVAHQLRELGARPDDFVGLCCPPSALIGQNGRIE